MAPQRNHTAIRAPHKQVTFLVSLSNVHPLLHGLSARRCPMSPHFLTRWLWYPGLSPVLVSNACPFAFHIWVFFSFTLIRLPVDFIRLFLTVAVPAPRHQPSSYTQVWNRCHEIDYPPELTYPRGYSISIPIYPPPRKITTDAYKVTSIRQHLETCIIDNWMP